MKMQYEPTASPIADEAVSGSIRFFITALWVLLGMLPAKAQALSWTIQGKVLEKETNQPIPFANIGIVGKNAGTLSNPDGSFRVVLSETHLSDSLTVAALGFTTTQIPVRTLIQQGRTTIYLPEKVYQLAEIIVRPSSGKVKESILGISRGNGGGYSGSSQTAGAAMALQLTPETVPYQLTKARLRIFYNPFPDCTVRIRILDVDPSTGKPGKDLLEENVINTAAIEKGWLEADLTNYAIWLNQTSFYIAFEWIEDDTRRKTVAEFWDAYAKANPDKMKQEVRIVNGEEVPVTISTELIKNATYFATSTHARVVETYPCYYRNSSLDDWKRSSSVLVATATVVYVYE